MAERDERRATWCARLPAETESVLAARRFVAEAATHLGATSALDDAKLLVSELTTNVVRHAHTPMRLRVCRHDERLRVEVRDDLPERPPGARPAPLAEQGRGMLLVHAIAVAWGVNANEKGKTVWFELGAPGDQAG